MRLDLSLKYKYTARVEKAIQFAQRENIYRKKNLETTRIYTQNHGKIFSQGMLFYTSQQKNFTNSSFVKIGLNRLGVDRN